MRWDNLSGRRERRLPIVVAVRLQGLEPEDAEEHEKTYTDNLSAQGVRVQSRRPWHPGQRAEITPWNREIPVRAEVVYCQKVDKMRFWVGLKLPQGNISWAVLKRYDGISS
jgi:hypothetical protein